MANPALMDKRISQLETASATERPMSRLGVQKALGIFVVFLLIGGYFGWYQGDAELLSGHTSATMMVSILVAFGLAMLICAKPKLARVVGIAYSLLEGFALGLISAVYNAQYHGIVIDAVGVTVAVALSVWFLYGTGIIKVTAKTTRVISMAVIGAMVFYGLSLLSMLFSGSGFDSSGGVLGIGISLVLAVIAASTFLIDFDRIDKMIAANADAQYDWYGAFGLLVSMVWLYLEILNVLGKARGGGIRR
jgi:uncharacterized YccA/Bax inhibitor family protein